jgi:hypothetical protein
MVHAEVTPIYHITSAVFLITACIILPLALESCTTKPAMWLGETMVLSPVETQQKYKCAASRGIQFELLQNIVEPNKVQPGESINQRLYYYMCSPSVNDTLQVRVTRVLSFSKKELSREVDSYRIKSGTWLRGVIFSVPEDAETGEYELNTTVSYQNKIEKISASFHIKKPFYKP